MFCPARSGANGGGRDRQRGGTQHQLLPPPPSSVFQGSNLSATEPAEFARSVRVASFRFFVNLFADIELSPSSVGFLTGCS